uniref:Tetraspanin n=1 Tax=Lotharella oceanica TaxID=641309 RepID=A0A7S2TV62_9EUKA|mmetsp:Transcript_3126/g.6074  ORF Transcript_3126/g.6074 Transcript_3126/m.6074 type:complete len:358 (+) Transcript_3126:82-1155(+)
MEHAALTRPDSETLFRNDQFTCGDHFRRFIAMVLNGAAAAFGALLLGGAIYVRYFSVVGKLYRSLDTSRPYCEGEECEERIIDLEQLIDMALLAVAGAGALILLCAAMGYRAASTKNSCCLRTQVFLVVTLILLQLGAGIAGVVYRQEIMSLPERAWNLDIGVRAKIGKGRNERKVFVPPVQCAIQEGLQCFGYDNYNAYQMQFNPGYMPPVSGVPSCPGANRPPSGGVRVNFDQDATGLGGGEEEEEEEGLGPSRDVCCPTPAQRVIPRVQFDPIDPTAPECSFQLYSLYYDNKLYVFGAVVGVLVMQILLVYTSQGLADASAAAAMDALRKGSGSVGLDRPLMTTSVSSYHSRNK